MSDDLPPRPKSLAIHAEPWEFYPGAKIQNVLFGVEENGQKWMIRWCSNGPHSHWVLTPFVRERDMDGGREVKLSERGWYVYAHHENNDRWGELKEQIQAAEHKYKIYI